jgi:putative endonuclease
MFYTYIIYSKLLDKFYIGSTNNPERRLWEHNSRLSTYTKQTSDWTKVFSKGFLTRSEAIKFEKYLKSLKNCKVLTDIILGS